MEVKLLNCSEHQASHGVSLSHEEQSTMLKVSIAGELEESTSNELILFHLIVSFRINLLTSSREFELRENQIYPSSSPSSLTYQLFPSQWNTIYSLCIWFNNKNIHAPTLDLKQLKTMGNATYIHAKLCTLFVSSTRSIYENNWLRYSNG